MPDDMSHRPYTEDEALPKATGRALRRARLIIAVIFVAVLAAGTVARVLARQALHETTQAQAIQTVKVEHPRPVAASALVLPARLEAWSQAPVYARTDGYLRRWYADIGTHVKQGAVLADIDTPEVDQQLAAAKAALATANAELSLAQTTSARWERLLAQNAVSRQDADDRRGDAAAKLAMRNEAAANLDRLAALRGFQTIVAPFDGVVTSRSTDIGALIVAGSAGSAPLFTVADLTRLRIYVSVPQSYLSAIRPGLAAHFTVPEFPGENFAAVIDRTSGAIDPQSGAMLVQLEFDNRAGRLKPGGYADITFDLPSESDTTDLLRIPAEALLFRKEGTTVAVANPNGTVSIRHVSIASDLGTELQVRSGLTAQDWIIDSPSDGIEQGDKIRIQTPASAPHA